MRFLFLFLLLIIAPPALAADGAAAPLVSDAVIAMLVPLVASAVASGFNAWLRASKRKGKRRGPATLALGAAINTVALNFDQAKRQAQAATQKGPQP